MFEVNQINLNVLVVNSESFTTSAASSNLTIKKTLLKITFGTALDAINSIIIGDELTLKDGLVVQITNVSAENSGVIKHNGTVEGSQIAFSNPISGVDLTLNSGETAIYIYVSSLEKFVKRTIV